MIGEPYDAPGLTLANREGEYKFWDKSNLELFYKVDGMPTAARALLFAMRGMHEIGERHDVWMAFVGRIDQGEDLWRTKKTQTNHYPELAPPTPRRVRLQSIVGPLKFWDNLPNKYPKYEELLQDEDDGDITVDHCQPFWRLAVDVIHDAPHMLKRGYSFQGEKKKVGRFSWARVLVMLFTPEAELMSQLKQAGIANDPPEGWYQRFCQETKELAVRHASPKLRGSINKGWNALCDELHKIYYDHELYMDGFVSRTRSQLGQQDPSRVLEHQFDDLGIDDDDSDDPLWGLFGGLDEQHLDQDILFEEYTGMREALNTNSADNSSTSTHQPPEVARGSKKRKREEADNLIRRPARWNLLEHLEPLPEYIFPSDRRPPQLSLRDFDMTNMVENSDGGDTGGDNQFTHADQSADQPTSSAQLSSPPPLSSSPQPRSQAHAQESPVISSDDDDSSTEENPRKTTKSRTKRKAKDLVTNDEGAAKKKPRKMVKHTPKANPKPKAKEQVTVSEDDEGVATTKPRTTAKSTPKRKAKAQVLRPHPKSIFARMRANLLEDLKKDKDSEKNKES